LPVQFALVGLHAERAQLRPRGREFFGQVLERLDFLLEGAQLGALGVEVLDFERIDRAVEQVLSHLPDCEGCDQQGQRADHARQHAQEWKQRGAEVA